MLVREDDSMSQLPKETVALIKYAVHSFVTSATMKEEFVFQQRSNTTS